MKPAVFCLTVFLLSACRLPAQTSGLELEKASAHPMQYYISLPENWSPAKKYPVVIAISDADKKFKADAERFVKARKEMPFILVVPFVTTNGMQGQRDSTVYPYSKAVWDTISKVSICRFDIEGLQNIIKDVSEKYSGSDKVFITGFEAGAHTVWAVIFQHPEWLYAAAPVAGNYRNRCMESGGFSDDPSRSTLLIKNFTGAEDADFGTDARLYSQYLEAKKIALSHGYSQISETEIKGKGHVVLPDEVLFYFNTVWESLKK